MALTPQQQIVAAALEVLASVSAQRLKDAVDGHRDRKSVLVRPGAFAALANAVEAVLPGAIADCRAERLQLEAAGRARRALERAALEQGGS